MNTIDIEQVYKAWQAVGADIAGLKWEDFAKHLPEQPTQQEPVAMLFGSLPVYDKPAQQEPVATGVDAELVERLASATPKQLDTWLTAARRHEARKMHRH